MDDEVKREPSLDIASDTKASPTADSPQPSPTFDSEAERRLLRKLDWILLPLFTAICEHYVSTLADTGRVAHQVPSKTAVTSLIGHPLEMLELQVSLPLSLPSFLSNSQLATGMEHDLEMRPFDLNIALTVFYVCIFLIEGLITLIFGLVLLVICPEDPNKSKILNQQERALAIARIDADQVVKTDGRKERTTVALVLRSFNFITIACTVCYIMVNMSFQGLSLFMPTVIRSLGNYSTIEVQLRTVPPYVCSGTWVVINAYISARIKKRFIPLLFNAMLMALGYVLSLATRNSHARYAACFLTMMGASVCGPVLLTWGTDNAAPDTMKAVVTAIIPGFGALGSILA
ncbi:hypothetical protein MD484_g4623, partial [Candolleomyces efflorescens]